MESKARHSPVSRSMRVANSTEFVPSVVLLSPVGLAGAKLALQASGFGNSREVSPHRPQDKQMLPNISAVATKKEKFRSELVSSALYSGV